LNNIETKINQLRDDSEIDFDTRMNLWRETIHLRRKNVRDRTTAEILEEFIGYKDPVLVSLLVACYFHTY
jgi:hypothetical protein